MTAHLELDLPRDPSAGALARDALTRRLTGAVDGPQLGDLLLVVTELVNNAVQHGQGGIRLRVSVEEGTVHGEVIDEGSGFERSVRRRGADAVTGRGLGVVDAAVGSWGIHEGTTHIWFEMETHVWFALDDSGDEPSPRLGTEARPDALDD
jgi:anti-sigma regulatory factor (Ser/Thr protein kinase)